MSKWVLLYGAEGQLPRRFTGFLQRPYSIGRSVEADVYIDDPAISRIQFTVQPTAQGLRLLSSPESDNIVRHNDRPILRASLRPGDVVVVGAWRFTVEAEAPSRLLDPPHQGEPPEPSSPVPRPLKPPTLPGDPAGPVDVKLAAGPLPPPPRWRRESAPQVGAPVPPSGPRGWPIWLRATVLSAGVGLLGYALTDVVPISGPATSLPLGPTPDLFVEAPPLPCQSPTQCVNMAREFDRTAESLLAQRQPDLRTLYQAARYLHSATVMTPGEPETIAGLRARYRRVQLRFNEALADARLSYELALQRGARPIAIDSLRQQLALFDKDTTHAYKTLLQRSLAQLEEPSR